MKFFVILSLAGCLSWDKGNPYTPPPVHDTSWIRLTCHADECDRQAEQICHSSFYDIEGHRGVRSFDNTYDEVFLRCK